MSKQYSKQTESPKHASTVADCLVAADLRGVDTHGVNRIPSFVVRIRQGVLDPAAEPELKEITPVVSQVAKAKRRGEKILMSWALDVEGRQTDDPAAALKGVMLPMGGPKGSALAIMMDVFSGVYLALLLQAMS